MEAELPEHEDEVFMYECVREEIALEGLDGITLQGLWERLIDRENAPISRGESNVVKSSIWEAIKRDPGLALYLLREPRPILKIWNRGLKTDARGNVEEPVDAPEDIYPYKVVEIPLDEKSKRLKKEEDGMRPLTSLEVKRIDPRSHQKSQFMIDGIRFECSENSTDKEGQNRNKSNGEKSRTSERPERESNGSQDRLRSTQIRGDLSKNSTICDKTPGSGEPRISKDSDISNKKSTRSKAVDPAIEPSKSITRKSGRSKTIELTFTASKAEIQKSVKSKTVDTAPIISKSDVHQKSDKCKAVEPVTLSSKLEDERSRNSKTIKPMEEISKAKIKSPLKKLKAEQTKTIKVEVKELGGKRKDTKSAGDKDMDSEDKINEKLPLMLVRGSCPEYYSRKDISNKIRQKKITYSQAAEIFGNRLVVVANQFLREKILINRSNQVRLASKQYCMIERIGRARQYGEQARGKISLTCLQLDSKSQFYHRKVLLADQLIAKQGFIMRFPENRTGTLISVFHLPFFFRCLESAEAVNIRKIFFLINSSPIKTVEYYKAQNSFGKHLIRVINESYSEFIEDAEEMFTVLYPEEYEKERKPSRKEKLLKRKIRVLRLKNAEFGIRKLIEKQLTTKAEADDTPLNMHQIEDGEVDEEDEFDWDFCQYKDVEMAHELEITTLMKYIIARGNKGALLQDIADYLNINHLDSRSASRYLRRWKLVNIILEEQDKIKLARYVYSRCHGPTQTAVLTDDEQEKESFVDVDAAVNALFDTTMKRDPESSFIESCDIDAECSESFTLSNHSCPSKSPCEIPTVTCNITLDVSNLIPAKSPIKSSKHSQKLSGPKNASPRKKKGMISKLNLETSGFKSEDIQHGNFTPSKDVLFVNPIGFPENSSHTKSSSKGRDKGLENLLEKTQSHLLLQSQESSGSKRPSPRKRSVSRYKTRKEEDYTPPDLEKPDSPRKSRTEQAYDDTDRKALGLLKKQRVEWTADEDRVLLHAFVSSVLFIARYNMDKVFIFNSTQIRDILHRVAEESKSKTAIAIRRRLHFLMKRRIFYARYRNLLNSALRDENLYINFVEKKLPQPAMNIYHSIHPEDLFRVFEYLMGKFYDTVDLEFTPSNFTASLEEVISLRELRRMEGIWIDVWAALFRETDGIHVDNDYQGEDSSRRKPIGQFEDDDVSEDDYGSAKKMQKLFSESESCQGGGLPSENLQRMDQGAESYEVRDKVQEYLDEEIQYAYQVSKRLFEDIEFYGIDDDSEDGSDDCEDSLGFGFKKNKSTSGVYMQSEPEASGAPNKTLDRKRRVISLRRKRTLDSKTDISTCLRDAEDAKDLTLWAGRTALLSMIFSGEVFDTVKSFMASIADSNLEKAMCSLRTLGILSVTKVTNRFCLSSQMRRQLTCFVTPTAFRIANCLFQSFSERQITSLHNYDHLGTVYLLSELSLMLKVKICLPECIIVVHDEYKKDYERLLNVNSNEEGDNENIALRLIRQRLNGKDKSKFVEKDFFDINLPQIEIRPKKGVNMEDAIFRNSRSKYINDKVFLENSLIKMVEYDERYARFGAPDKDRYSRKYNWLYDAIEATDEVGLSMHYLLKNFNRDHVKKGLEYLLDCNYIYMVGIYHRKFVAGPAMKHWTTRVVSDGGLSIKRVVMRPWMNGRGEMNWTLLDRAYTGILGFLQRYPILMVNKLCRFLAPILSNVETLILLTTLHHLEIVEFYRMNKGSEFSLFSKPKKSHERDLEFPFKDYEVDPFLDLETTFVELVAFHCVKYAKLQHAICPTPRTDNPLSLVEEDQEEVLLQDEGNATDVFDSDDGSINEEKYPKEPTYMDC